jgi:hypothetical protein
MENQSTVGTTPNQFQVRRKRKNRYLNTLIHDRTLYWIGTGTLIKRGGVKLVLQAESSRHGEEYIIAQSVARWSLQTLQSECDHCEFILSIYTKRKRENENENANKFHFPFAL